MSNVIEIGDLDASEQMLVRDCVERHGGGNPRLRELIRRECSDVLRRNRDYPRSFAFEPPHPLGRTPEEEAATAEAIAEAATEYVIKARLPLLMDLLNTTVALCVERVKQ